MAFSHVASDVSLTIIECPAISEKVVGEYVEIVIGSSSINDTLDPEKLFISLQELLSSSMPETTYCVRVHPENSTLMRALFASKFFLIGFSSASTTEEPLALFVYASDEKRLERFFSDPGSQKKDSYSKADFSQPDTFVPLFEGGKMLESGLMTLRTIMDRSFSDLNDLPLVGVLFEDRDAKSGVVLAGSKPPLK